MSELNMSDIANSAHTIAEELKAIRHVLSALWHSKYFNDETDQVSPEFFADEYISTTECARRLNVTEQTIRNWILAGKKKDPHKKINAWIQGVHYILIPTGPKRDMVRIGWNNLIKQFTKGVPADLRTFDVGASRMYESTTERFEHVPKPKE